MSTLNDSVQFTISAAGQLRREDREIAYGDELAYLWLALGAILEAVQDNDLPSVCSIAKEALRRRDSEMSE